MAIKFGMTVADMIMQLTKGFMKATGRKPDGLEKIKIQQEANQRFKDMNKVVDMEGKSIDTGKGIMGGKQAKAMGGRIGFGGGSDMGTVGDSKGNVGPGKGGYQGGGTGPVGRPGSGGSGNTNPNTNPIVETTKNAVKNIAINEISKKLGFAKFSNPIGQLMAIKGLYDSVKNPMGTPSQFGIGNLFGDDDEEKESKSNKDDLTGMAGNVRNMDQVMDRQAQIEARAKELGFADGGRIGYKLGSLDKARRAFLKKAAGIGGGIAALKTGLIGLSKQAGPAVEAVKETVTQAPSYFFDLVAKIKILGKPGISTGPRQNTMNYKNYELMEDVSTGDIRITKQKGDPDFGYEEEVMEYRKGQRTEDGVIPDEYEEATIRPDGDGKMKDFEDGIEPDSIEEIIKEVSEEAPSIKKAGGGIARMLGE